MHNRLLILIAITLAISLNGCSPVHYSLEDAVADHLALCWSITNKDKPDAPIVKIHVWMNPDASIKEMQVVDPGQYRYKHDPIFKKQADAIMTALRICSPISFLPKSRYNEWENMVLTFDPHNGPAQ